MEVKVEGNEEFEDQAEQSVGSNQKSKKVHSIKVPRLYKEAAKALKNVEENGEGLKASVYSIKHPNTKALTALVSESLKNSTLLETLFTKARLRENEPGLSIPLAKILITELLWGKKRLGGDAKPVVTIRNYEGKFHSILLKLERKNRKNGVGEGAVDTGVKEREVLRKPRYVRINTLMSTVEQVIDWLQSEGWVERDPPENLLDDWNTPDEFCRDSFVDNLLVFPPSTEFHSHELYSNGTLILQDKASCLPALALKPRRGRQVIDACAAPGMKTSHLAALMENDGQILAVEKSTKRAETLERMKEWLSLACVQVERNNFSDIDPSQHPDVEYILLDPSCSGSGMYGRIDAHINEKQNQRGRLESLSFCQRKLLLHAMKFPGVKRIVYSTCSIFSEENEDVIANALEGNNLFKLKKALPSWPHRLENKRYPWADHCVVADHKQDRTDGFFVALLEKVKAKNKNANGQQEYEDSYF